MNILNRIKQKKASIMQGINRAKSSRNMEMKSQIQDLTKQRKELQERKNVRVNFEIEKQKIKQLKQEEFEARPVVKGIKFLSGKVKESQRKSKGKGLFVDNSTRPYWLK